MRKIIALAPAVTIGAGAAFATDPIYAPLTSPFRGPSDVFVELTLSPLLERNGSFAW